MNAYEVLGYFMIGLSVFLFGAFFGVSIERRRFNEHLKRLERRFR